MSDNTENKNTGSSNETPQNSTGEGKGESTTTSQLQDRLFQLRMKINQGRKANKDEVEEEYKRMTSKKSYHKETEEDDDEPSSSNKKYNKGNNGAKEQDIMNQTAEEASWVAEKNKKKAETAATFGLNAFAGDQYYRAYEKRLKKLPTVKAQASEEGDQEDGTVTIKKSSALSLSENPMEYGKINAEVSDAALEKLSNDILEREHQRKKFGKRRLQVDGDIDYINDKNAKFNRKLDKAFDKYTVEIRQNLERGTAV